MVINTHRGFFRYKRLPYGISSAVGIFQRTIESLLQGIPNIVIYLYDILITGSTEDLHLETLGEVLRRIQKAGLKLRSKKCVFMVPSVIYLGYRIDAQELHPMPDKVKAVMDAPQPKTVTKLKSYLGLLNYYGKFLPNTTILATLYTLTKVRTLELV